MRNIHPFEVCGNVYRVKDFSATDGVVVISGDEPNGLPHPMTLLKHCEVFATDGWVELTTREAVNDLVNDALGIIRPVDVLHMLLVRIYEINFAFLKSWKPLDIPRRLTSDLPDGMAAPRMDPVISLIVMAEKATLKELEEYYSTEDAFKMYDMIAVDNLNKALSAESAMNEAKSKRR